MLKEILLQKMQPEPNSGCWIWTSTIGTDGYGKFIFQRKRYRAHRASYQTFIGALTPGLYVCHKCDNPSCINPDHLFQGTNRENQIDCNKKGRRWTMQGTHCIKGHELSGYNLILQKRKDPSRVRRRRCRICANLRTRRYARKEAMCESQQESGPEGSGRDDGGGASPA